MKSIANLGVSVVLLLTMISCNRSPNPEDVVSRLPELPAKLAVDLAPTKVENVLMCKPPADVHKPPANPAMPVQSTCVLEYSGFVVYPLTVCFPPRELVTNGEFLAVEARTAPAGPSPSLSPKQYYKLSKPALARINMLFCEQSGGPWFAKVTTQTFCDSQIPHHSTLEIIGGPQPFSVSWDGDLRDVPPPFDPHGFGLSSETCGCCGGFTQCPDGRCLPPGVNCTISPARKEPLPK